ncbi:MAG: rubrerythrin family protein [bacterium]|nr:rubrerythrin family protein [bacterium]
MGDKTTKNLKDAFAGESQASRKYASFSKKAKDEGNEQVAKLFKAASIGEEHHARNHLKAMKGVGSIEENLQAAYAGETEEIDNMYPGMIDSAKEEGASEAEESFTWAMTVEKEHQGFFNKASEQLGNNEAVEYYVCGNCGHVHLGEAPENCPVCGFPKSQFDHIEI